MREFQLGDIVKTSYNDTTFIGRIDGDGGSGEDCSYSGGYFVRPIDGTILPHPRFKMSGNSWSHAKDIEHHKQVILPEELFEL